MNTKEFVLQQKTVFYECGNPPIPIYHVTSTTEAEGDTVVAEPFKAQPKPTMKKFIHLLNDQTHCFEIDSSGSSSQHELGELTKLTGHASLTSALNDMDAWGMTVAQVAQILLND